MSIVAIAWKDLMERIVETFKVVRRILVRTDCVLWIAQGKTNAYARKDGLEINAIEVSHLLHLYGGPSFCFSKWNEMKMKRNEKEIETKSKTFSKFCKCSYDNAKEGISHFISIYPHVQRCLTRKLVYRSQMSRSAYTSCVEFPYFLIVV